MPPRHTYWTIIFGNQPTAFRTATREELLPTFRQIQGKHPDAVMMWFARGRLWRSEEEAREAFTQRHDRPRAPKPQWHRDRGPKPEWRDRPPREDRPQRPRDEKPQWRDRPPREDRPPRQDRPPRPREDKPQWRDRPPRPRDERPQWRDRPPREDRPPRPREDRPPSRDGERQNAFRGPKPAWKDRPRPAAKDRPQPAWKDRPRSGQSDRPFAPKDRWRDRPQGTRPPGPPRSSEGGAGGERRGRDWRPGGDHKDPRDRFKVPRDVKRARFKAKLQRDRFQPKPKKKDDEE